MAVRVVWPKPRQVYLEHGPELTPAKGEVFVETRVSLVSPGTERAFLSAAENTSGKFPMYPGYSSVGIVRATGSGIRRLHCGDRVFVDTGHASSAVVDEDRAVLVPEGLSDERAVLARVGTIALQAIRRSGLEVGEPVLILGAGLIGLLTAQCAYIAGATRVAIVEPDPNRRIWAQGVLGPRALEVVQAYGDLTWIDSVRVVVEASGNPRAIIDALEVAPMGARVVLLGSSRGLTPALNYYETVHKKGLTVVGAHNDVRPKVESCRGYWTWHDDMDATMELLAQDRLGQAIQPVERYKWTDVGLLYKRLLQNLGALVILIMWEGPGSG